MSGRLTISLSALAANYAHLVRQATGDVAAVVKADAYGLGAPAIASRLKREGCTEFFVATADEGTRLRHAHEDVAIYVLEGAYAENVPALVNSDLIPVLNTVKQCQDWSPAQRPAAVHIDSGMQRLGFPYRNGLGELAGLAFPVHLFISHFARADEPGHGSIVQQMAHSGPLYAALQREHPQMRLSLCNSAGLLEGVGPEDLGRAGIALYGGNPFDDLPNPMTAVARLDARIMQVRDVGAGVAVGYGGAFVTTRPSKLAILGVGYADGVPRLLSNQGRVFAGGEYCPIVGRVSMDLLIVDVTGAEVLEGDWAEVVGTRVPLDEVATQAQTLTYEILTGISTRVPRLYVERSL